jgi:putative peptidoglycan lipid II flippase
MASKRHPLIAGTVVTSLGTLASRGLGLLREMATGWLFGIGGKPGMAVADAFLFAYRIPNLFRQLFGEGAMTASFLPVLTGELEIDRKTANQLASVVVVLLGGILTSFVAVGELLIGLIWWLRGDAPGVSLLLGLSAVMLPYLIFVCIAAQLTTMLYVKQHFTVPALAPTMLSVVWLTAAWGVAPLFPGNQVAQAYTLAVGVLVAGVAQIVVQLPKLRQLGFRFDFHWTAARKGVGQIVRNMSPTMVGLAVTQINTFVDSLIAWGLAAASNGPQTFSWFGHTMEYPMKQGAVAAIYFGDRLCEFPLGVVGLAVAVAIFPLLSRHAQRGDFQQLGDDMTLGLRLVLCLAVPAGVGLFLLAVPIMRLFFQHFQFNAEDTIRAARMVAWYGTGVWAYCASAVVVRGYYAMGDFRTPVRVAVWAVGLNLTLNLTLIWPMAEAGLAVSTSICAALQVMVLVVLFSRRLAPLRWRQLTVTIARTLLATAAMTAAVLFCLAKLPAADSLKARCLQLAVPLVSGVVVYVLAYLLMGGREFAMLLGGKDEERGTKNED